MMQLPYNLFLTSILSVFLVVVAPIIVYFSGLYRPRRVAIAMAVSSIAFVVGVTVPHYPEFIKGILVGYVSAYLLFHLIVLVLRKHSSENTHPYSRHENK